jgi:hypothetical protein
MIGVAVFGVEWRVDLQLPIAANGRLGHCIAAPVAERKTASDGAQNGF